MNRRALIVFLSLAGLAAAQEVRREVRVLRSTESQATVGAVGTAGVRFFASEFSEGKPVKGSPYSAEAVTESVQALADGNRITRKNSSKQYRDSEGRTRREETMGAIGPWASGMQHEMIFINDPVAGVHYLVNPQTKEVEKMTRSVSWTTTSSQTEDFTIALGAGQPMTAGKRVHIEQIKPGETPDVFNLPVAAPAVPAIPHSGEGDNLVFFGEASSADLKTEDLGKQTIEGLLCEGKRTTSTIPAGAIGNERPVVTTAERWYSPELQMTVMSKRSDPRMGETTYRLTNVSRVEPASALFQPPPDYKVNEGGAPRLMRMEKKRAQ